MMSTMLYPSNYTALVIVDSQEKLNHFIQNQPIPLSSGSQVNFLLTTRPVEEASSLVAPAPFDEVIAYYPETKDAHLILAETFPTANIRVFEMPLGHYWPPQASVSR